MAFQLAQVITANPDTATAMVQALQKSKFEIPMENGTTKRCGVDFLKIAVPNKAKIKRVRQKKEKGKGRGKKSAGQENVQFLTKDESGKVVGAVWTDPPPIHEPYKKNQRALRPLREEQKKIEAEDKAA